MEIAASEFLVALDIGSSQARCLIAELNDHRIQIVGRGAEPSRGVRRGDVIDLPTASYAANRAIQTAEQQASVEVRSLFLAAGSRHVNFVNNRACVAITREERTITARDIQSVLADARRVPLRGDVVSIGCITRSFAVDDVRHVRDPEGMHGARLEAEVHVITDSRTTTENLAACLKTSRIDVEEFVFAPYAAAEAVLSDDEKHLGVALMDIGAGTTGIILYRDGAPVFSSVIPVGGDHISSDIAIGMDFGMADAERLKERHASVGPPPSNQPIAFRRAANEVLYSIDPRRLRAIVEPRVHEILDIARRELVRAGVRPATTRVVLTGGTSRLPGICELASSVLGCSVRIGRPISSPDSLLTGAGPEMATAVGLLLVGMRTRAEAARAVDTPSAPRRLLDLITGIF